MVAGGLMDVFVSNEVVAQRKLTRLVALAAQGSYRALALMKQPHMCVVTGCLMCAAACAPAC